MTLRLVESALPVEVRLPRAPLPDIPPPGRLSHPARADGSVVELSARRVRVELSGTGGIRRVEGDGLPLAGPVRPGDTTGANLLFGPRAAQRECFHPGGGVVEAVQLPEALPGIVLQWRRTGPVPHPNGELRVTVELLPPHPGGSDPPSGGTVRFHRAPGLLWVARDRRGVLLWGPGTASLPELEAGGERLTARWTVSLEEPGDGSLLVQSAPPDGPWSDPGALAAVAAHHARGERAGWESDDPGLTLETGVPEMDMGLRWARAWIRDRLLTPPGSRGRIHPVDPSAAILRLPGVGPVGAPALPTGRPAGPAWLALAAAGSGDREAGRAALNRLDWSHPSTRLLATLALARWTAWTGDAAVLREARERLVRFFGDPEARRGLPDALVQLARREVVSAGEAAEIPELRELPGVSTRGVRRLPVAGGEAPPPDLLPWSGREGVPPTHRLDEVLATRRTLSNIAEAPGRLRGGLGIAAVLGLVSGLLGAQPEATFGRLTLSPLLPPHWTRFSARGIRTGEGVVDLDFRKEGPVARWTLRPRAGSVPLMLVFQPWHPLPVIRRVRVDGAQARVDVHPEAGWARAMLQLPVDGVRTVELEG